MRVLEQHKPKRLPQVRLHKPTGQYRITLSGKDHWLGTDYRTARLDALRLLAEWELNHRRPMLAPDDISVSEVCERFKSDFCPGYYGKDSRTLDDIARALKPLADTYGPTPAAEFGPRAMKALRQQFVERELSRAHINKLLFTWRRVFKWAASEELIPAETYHALQAVETLRKGRSAAKEATPRKAVTDIEFDALKPHVTPTVWDILQLLRLTGARPGELLTLRPCDIDRSSKPWCARLESHKMAYMGKVRTLWFGAQARTILAPILLRKRPTEYLFSPRDSFAERKAPLDKRRRKGQPETPRQTDRVVGDHYIPVALARCVARAIVEANKERVKKDQAPIRNWCPYELRHTAATRAREAAGLDAAQVLLGHATANVTQIYAHLNDIRAAQIAETIG